MANSNNDVQANGIVETDVPPAGRSPNETQQYRLASEKNRLRWEHQEKHEKALIESYINEDYTTKQRRSILMAVKMSEAVLKIQEALRSGIEHDLPKATESLKILLKEPFTTMSLLYAPRVVKTVYLCCRYTNSEIRELAEKCYRRFRPCFGVPYGKTFETTFQSAVRNFWEKQDSVTNSTIESDYRHFAMNDDVGLPTDGGNVEEKEIEAELYPDDKKLVIKEEMDMEITPDVKSTVGETEAKIKAECENETHKLQYDCNIAIKQEIVDTDEVEIADCTIKPENITDMLEISVKSENTDIKSEYIDIKSEPSDFGNISAESELDKCKVLTSNIELESISGMSELSVKLEPIDFEELNIRYDYEKDCYILKSPQ